VKRISYWARTHSRTAILLIILIKLLLAAGAVYTGTILSNSGKPLSPLFLLFAFLLMITAMLCYPRGSRKGHFNYYIQKSCDIAMSIASFVSIVCMTSNNFRTFAVINETRASTGFSPAVANPTATEILNSLNHRDKESLSRREKRVLKKEFFRQVVVYGKARVAGEEEKAKHALAIILAIIATVGLLYLLGALVCNLACSGSDGAAIMLGLLGLTAIIFGWILLIRKIGHKERNK
jgi:hypothetical protein